MALAKSTKKAFSEAARPCTRAICLFWVSGQEILPGLSHGGSFKETSVFSCRPRPLRARPRLPMGEMQGALARARLESLLRPRHKKRAEVQKRSESFLLTGLGKRRGRHAGTVPLCR